MDTLVRAITKDGLVKACAINAPLLTERSRQIHKTLPVATAALGRLLCAASMMGNTLKKDGASLTLQVRGDGALGAMIAVSDHLGNVRGHVTNPAVDLPLRDDKKLDVGRAVGGHGTLTVIKDLQLKEPYIGTVELLGGEIAEDIAQYFVESEQIPTICALGVLIDRDQSVRHAGGYLIQLLPGADENTISKVESGFYAAGSITQLLSENQYPVTVLQRVLSNFELDILETTPVTYRCDCSKERVKRVLLSLGANELSNLLKEQGQAEITCRFCDTVHHFTGEELQSMIDRI